MQQPAGELLTCWRDPISAAALWSERATRAHSGVNAQRGLWEVHYDPYDLTQVFVRTTDGWITAPWTHLPMVSAPFAEFTWRHARTLTAEKGLDDSNETAVARVLDDLRTRA